MATASTPAQSANRATVSAVRTTGIYCRSGCVAKPKPENTALYGSPVAAESAGYRACLRCHPEREPDIWLSNLAAPQPVEAALLLIGDGFLDTGTEAELASEIGYSARQLRRLFAQHIGATPDYIARSRRAHFARRLIDDTNLGFAAIATVAGFGSQRQLHRSITNVFGFSPTQLRVKRRRGERPATDGGLRLLVPYIAPYDFTQMLGHLRTRSITGVESVTADTYSRSISVCGNPGMVEVTDANDGQHLALTLHLATYNCVIGDVQRCRTLFATDEDPRHAVKHLRTDQLLKPLVRQRPGLRVPRCWDRFETVVRIIVGQQISVKGASTLTGRIATAVGEAFDSNNAGITHTFPDAHTLAQHSLTGLGLTKRRIDTLRAASTAVASGDINLLSAASLSEVVDQWCEIPGIGPWTAQLIAMRVYRHDDAWPTGDLGLQRGLEQASPEHWRPYRSWAAQHIWSATGLHNDSTNNNRRTL